MYMSEFDEFKEIVGFDVQYRLEDEDTMNQIKGNLERIKNHDYKLFLRLRTHILYKNASSNWAKSNMDLARLTHGSQLLNAYYILKNQSYFDGIQTSLALDLQRMNWGGDHEDFERMSNEIIQRSQEILTNNNIDISTPDTVLMKKESELNNMYSAALKKANSARFVFSKILKQRANNTQTACVSLVDDYQIAGSNDIDMAERNDEDSFFIRTVITSTSHRIAVTDCQNIAYYMHDNNQIAINKYAEYFNLPDEDKEGLQDIINILNKTDTETSVQIPYYDRVRFRNIV